MPHFSMADTELATIVGGSFYDEPTFFTFHGYGSAGTCFHVRLLRTMKYRG
ncbi:MAG: hypothetical protein WBW85_21065 [Terriglobales bacterium]